MCAPISELPSKLSVPWLEKRKIRVETAPAPKKGYTLYTEVLHILFKLKLYIS